MSRQPRPSRAIQAGAALLVLAGLWVVGRAPLGLELVIRPSDGSEPLAILPLEPGEHFTLHYRHSVDHGPIWEEHSVDRAGNIYIEEERFTMFGAGMGHWPGHGRVTRRDSLQVIEGIHAPTGDIVLRVGGGEVGHALLWRGGRIDLSAVAAGRAVRIAAQPVRLLTVLRHRILAAGNGTPEQES